MKCVERRFRRTSRTSRQRDETLGPGCLWKGRVSIEEIFAKGVAYTFGVLSMIDNTSRMPGDFSSQLFANNNRSSCGRSGSSSRTANWFLNVVKATLWLSVGLHRRRPTADLEQALWPHCFEMHFGHHQSSKRLTPDWKTDSVSLSLVDISRYLYELDPTKRSYKQVQLLRNASWGRCPLNHGSINNCISRRTEGT